jgi:phospholipid/cholesterol/gamma-HCH transport system substrate-binding protein
MQARVGYAAVGAFVLALGAALIVLGLWLGSGRERGEFRLYYAYTQDSVAALSPSSAVTYRGVDVGRVAAIELDPDDSTRVRLTLSIRAEAPVKTDTVATLAMQGLTGLGSVELTGGSRDAALLRETPGSRYPVIEMQPSLMNRLDTALRLAMSTLDQVCQRLLLLLDDRNVHAIGAILANVEQASGTLAGQGERLERTLADIERLAAVGAQAGEALPQLAPRVQAVLEQTEQLLATLRTSGEQVGSTARDSRRQLEYTGGVLLPQVERLVDDLGNAAGSLGELAERLNANPQMLLLGPPAREPGPGEE